MAKSKVYSYHIELNQFPEFVFQCLLRVRLIFISLFVAGE